MRLDLGSQDTPETGNRLSAGRAGATGLFGSRGPADRCGARAGRMRL